MSDLEKSEVQQEDAVNGRTNGVTNGQASTTTAAAAGGATTTQGKVKRHCARWWWVHAIIFIVVTLVIVLPVTYVGFPKIAQQQVNKSKLNVTAMSLKNLTSTGFDLEIDAVLTVHSAYHPTLEAYEGGLYLADTGDEFLTIPVPKVTARNGTPAVIKSTYTFPNSSSENFFAEYAYDFIKNSTMGVYLRGRGGLKQYGLPKIDVNYNKYIYLNGLSGISGLEIRNFTILTSSQPDYANFEGQVHIPNPTVQYLEMGNITTSLALPTNLTNTSSPLIIGNSTILDATLIQSTDPNDNVFKLRGWTNDTILLEMLDKYPDLAHSAGLPLIITGKSAVVNGQNIGWLSTALSKNSISYDLLITEALEKSGLSAFISGFSSSSSSSSMSSTTTSSASSSSSATCGGFLQAACSTTSTSSQTCGGFLQAACSTTSTSSSATCGGFLQAACSTTTSATSSTATCGGFLQAACSSTSTVYASTDTSGALTVRAPAATPEPLPRHRARRDADQLNARRLFKRD